MNRIVIFASYNPNGVILDYVIKYLLYLKEISEKIIFIADNETSFSQRQKLNDIVEYALFDRHGEYDFGSYKRGYLYAKENGLLANADELIFCNDSCMCLHSLKPVFDCMSQKNCDFWGMTQSCEHQSHLQSYFLVFRKNVILSSLLEMYFSKVKKQSCFWDIVRHYELPLKNFLEQHEYKGLSFVPLFTVQNPTTFPLVCFQYGSPLIKRKIFSENKYCHQSLVRTIIYIWRNYHSLSFEYFKLYFHSFRSSIKPFLFQKKITKSGKVCIKICRINVYSHKIY